MTAQPSSWAGQELSADAFYRRGMAALGRISDTLGLDYGGIDFGISRSGEVLLFEANATMVVIPPSDDERWAHRRTGVTRILDAVVAMMMKRAGGVVTTR